MKKVYVAPMLEIEKYELNSSIAANCTEVINLGPGGVLDYKQCSSYGDEDIWGDETVPQMLADTGSFYPESCSCYYTAGGEGNFTS